MSADRDRAIEIVESSRATHVDWLAWQEATPSWSEQVASLPASAGGPDHHRQAIEDYDVVLDVLRECR